MEKADQGQGQHRPRHRHHLIPVDPEVISPSSGQGPRSRSTAARAFLWPLVESGRNSTSATSHRSIPLLSVDRHKETPRVPGEFTLSTLILIRRVHQPGKEYTDQPLPILKTMQPPTSNSRATGSRTSLSSKSKPPPSPWRCLA